MDVTVVHGRVPAGYYRVDLWGEIDLYSAPEVRAAVSAVTESACRDVLLDVSRLTFLDIVGAHLLGEFLQITERRGGRLTVRAPTPQVARLLELTGLAYRVQVEQSPLHRQLLVFDPSCDDWRRRLN